MSDLARHRLTARAFLDQVVAHQLSDGSAPYRELAKFIAEAGDLDDRLRRLRLMRETDPEATDTAIAEIVTRWSLLLRSVSLDQS